MTNRFLSALGALALAVTASAAGGISSADASVEGSCQGYYDTPDALGTLDRRTGKIERTDEPAIMVESTQIRETPESTGRVVGALEFGERIFLSRMKGDFIEVMDDPLKDPTPLGWVRADDILCQATPLKTEKGLSRKFYIRTAANAVDRQQEAVEPKKGPESSECAKLNDKCQELTRFSRYYIFAEDPENNRVLLLLSATSESTIPLIGWVSADDGYRWNTRLGLRPADNMKVNPVTGALEVGEEIVACIYPTEQDALNPPKDRCDNPVLGGPRWFTSKVRLPILDDKKIGGRTFYRVALPVAGVGKDSRDLLLDRVNGLDNAIDALQDLKNLDVLFLIDGTESMEPHIAALVGRGSRLGIIPAIKNALDDNPRFRNVKVRYGYRVYRDTYAGNFGVNEGMRLSASCDNTERDIRENHENFELGISKIDTRFGKGSGRGDPDYEEALIMGLSVAVDDLTPCEKNVKMLFVIGDTGYDSERLKEQGVPIHEASQVVDLLINGTSAKQIDPIIPFFIQVPQPATVPQLPAQAQGNFQAAYGKFATQGRALARTVGEAYMTDRGSNVELRDEENFFSLDGREPQEAQRELVKIITEQVARFSDQAPVNEIIAGLQTGEALVEIITALQDAAGGVPALRLAQIERRVCETLGEACTEQIFSDTITGYVEADEDVVDVDVLLSGDELNEWRNMIEPLRDITAISSEAQSQLIVDMLVNATGKTLGELSPKALNMGISEFLTLQSGLPFNTKTPLMNYTLRDFVYGSDGEIINQESSVNKCERAWVAKWLQQRREIFSAVDRGEIPIMEFNEIKCPEELMRNQLIKDIDLKNIVAFPEPSEMDFSFVDLDRRQFWIPNEYLP